MSFPEKFNPFGNNWNQYSNEDQNNNQNPNNNRGKVTININGNIITSNGDSNCQIGLIGSIKSAVPVEINYRGGGSSVQTNANRANIAIIRNVELGPNADLTFNMLGHTTYNTNGNDTKTVPNIKTTHQHVPNVNVTNVNKFPTSNDRGTSTASNITNNNAPKIVPTDFWPASENESV